MKLTVLSYCRWAYKNWIHSIKAVALKCRVYFIQPCIKHKAWTETLRTPETVDSLNTVESLARTDLNLNLNTQDHFKQSDN